MTYSAQRRSLGLAAVTLVVAVALGGRAGTAYAREVESGDDRRGHGHRGADAGLLVAEAQPGDDRGAPSQEDAGDDRGGHGEPEPGDDHGDYGGHGSDDVPRG